ncbi:MULTISPECIES: bifunctional (p)ppGpp synthetase/guanosine-3',5'-bis(diphosphate) 3'-pyrophosphohydrolase [Rhodanobacter]|uniref:bifunctional (p)ppGpp synthetase/guanosine-3',5'-bis(diphosphate) 3'-pyrophosphohydrolase n=1 Tax=Rhodanobacter TaxID=75309 RepID=UPI00041F57E1|nr:MULTISPECIES: bifunctional (p)ppGpp synthetase/guanosine-3',5'-bis(diphosphate) 3'-pyrophosphohydrolase [Rhodanobacter]UJM93050.1 bifunctional (p)ppGpp synthetase/guanosine-3',5'-bis(diphosphate) 3'-pyrophosphohydrolase [Rhodanobacter denitrificans]UJM96580.1 bifunctional (p)ppGpp synthetase/guanosine-3',5'-bis(diphosphate) 3'-pyrophosphohydrolase [Rhodanobacter denitrificans]UJN20590.1 bifunctional (p)ppGpp synthetase/guanosine-3',5'-bis(diphosphate) 3'-pyrophosphohydrolase [Rhodanobacter de
MAPIVEPPPLSRWRERAGALPPLLADALEACATRAVDQAGCADVLELLSMLGCDAQTQAAALWFELARIDPALWAERRAALPTELQRLVDGQQAAERVWALHAQRPPQGAAEGLRRLLLAIVRDLRVVFVLLARQLARMRAAPARPEGERQALARLTRDIHAPLANRLGIWQLKWELEDLAFRYLQPDTYRRIANLLDERRADREAFIRDSLAELQRALEAAGIQAELAGRPKHIYSIWKKMQRKSLDFSDLYDIRAVRVLVDNITDCYAALGVVHALWPHLPGEFDDYIARPKANGYQSLHTAVIGPQGKTLEVQIRTHAMHRANELGVAAHWRYKEGGSADAEFEAKIAWMRKLLEPRGEDDSALAAELQTELLEDRVYLLTPKGEVFDLARGATVLDFAYLVHTEVGHRCRGAKVNGRIVPLTFQPQSGDRVEILTGKLAEPSRDWLSPHHGYLNTARAKEKVRAWFRKIAHDANLAVGRGMFERELKRLALSNADVGKLPAHFHLKNHDELLVALALGEVTPGQIARVLQEAAQPAEPVVTQSSAPVASRHATLDHSALRIEGIGNLLTTLARCCQPLPGDPVRGFVTKGRGVSVHRADCGSLARLARRDPDRVIEVSWGSATAQAYEVDIELRGYDRKGLQKDVTSVVSNAGTHIIASSSRLFVHTGEVEMRFTLRVRDFEQLSTLLGKLLALPNVLDVRRVGTG